MTNAFDDFKKWYGQLKPEDRQPDILQQDKRRSMKRGDRVRVARMSDYDIMVHKAHNIPLEIGRTGTVKELGYSRSHGDVVTVLMDDTKDLTIWCENELEIIE